MQTFLPFSNFLETAKCLDYRRLGKQRVEAKQIINTLAGVKTSWEHHPAIKMWRGYTEALKLYCNFMIDEWVNRGYNNTMQFYHINIYKLSYPNWLGNIDFHKSHQSNLVRKDSKYYRAYFPNIPDDLPYVWPI